MFEYIYIFIAMNKKYIKAKINTQTPLNTSVINHHSMY